MKTKCALTMVLLLAACIVVADDAQDRPFFAFDNGTGRGVLSFREQAEMLADIGYDGIGFTGVKEIPEALAALDEFDLQMFSTYVGIQLDPNQPAYDPLLPEAIKQLAPHKTVLWLYILGGAPSSTALDDRAVEVIRNVAEMADASGLRIALYPHTGFYVATTRDAVRVAEKVGRENVGVSFNLCHFLKQNDEADLRESVEAATPYLFLVSINGADSGDTRAMGWDRLIQTLDRGSYDVGPLLEILHELEYDGPVGLQCYAIPGDVRENLTRSMGAWQALAAD